MQSNRDFLLARIATVQSRLARAAPDDEISQINMASELELLRDELEGYEKTVPQHHATMAVAFGNGPVNGSFGIDANFAGKMLQRIQRLVSSIESEQTPQIKVKQVERAQLLVTGIVRGSFGFVLQEPDPPMSAVQLSLMEPGETTLTLAVERCALVLSKIGDADSGFRYLSESNDTVYSQFKQLFQSLASAGASLKGSTNRAQFSLSLEEVQAISKNLSEAVRSTTSGIIRGCLTGKMRFDREFEFWVEDESPPIKGRLGPNLKDEDLNQFIGVPERGDRHTGHFLLRTTTRGRNVHTAYVLIGLVGDDGSSTFGDGELPEEEAQVDDDELIEEEIPSKEKAR